MHKSFQRGGNVFASASLTALAIAWCAPAFAQAAPSAPAAAEDQRPALDEIIVTAQRREESLQKAAIAVTAITSAQIERAGVTEVTQLGRLAPSLQIGSVGGPINAFYLRGVGNFTTNANSDPAVAVAIDGVYIGRPTAVQGMFFDLQRIEVLKGPQGTLYGRNATGGAINVISNKPRIGEFGGYANVEFGNFSSKKADAAINLPIGARSALRIAGQIVDRDGYYSDGTGDENLQSVRVQFVTEPTSGFKVTAGFDFAHQGGIGSGATLLGLDRDKRIGLLDPRAVAVYNSTYAFLAGNTLPGLPESLALAGTTPPRYRTDLYNDNRFWGVYLQADVDTPIGTLTVLPAYRNSHLNYRTIATGFPLTELGDTDQTSVEARLVSAPGAGPLSYIAGVYYLNEKNDEVASYDQEYFGVYAHFLPKTESIAAYGRLNWSVTDRLRLTGGLRWTKDNKSTVDIGSTLVVLCPSALVPNPTAFCFGGPSLPATLHAPSYAFAPDGTTIPFQPFGSAGNFLSASTSPGNPLSKSFSRVTYRAGVEYDAGPHSLLYATYETGFKSGGFSGSVDVETYKPETISAITIGSKNRFFSNRLQVNVEAFRWIYKDQQISHFRARPGTGGYEFMTENIGKARLQGIELETQAAVTASTTLNATIQYLDAKRVSYVYDNAAAVGPPVTGCPFQLNPGGASFRVDCSGTTPPMAPKWTITAGIEQRFDLGRAGELVFNAQTRFQSKIVWDGVSAALPELSQKPYTMTDLQLQYTPQGHHFSVTGFVNNLENQNIVGFTGPHPQSASLIIQTLRAPRTYGIRLGAKF